MKNVIKLLDCHKYWIMSFYKKCRTVKDDVYMMMHYQNELSIANNFNT